MRSGNVRGRRGGAGEARKTEFDSQVESEPRNESEPEPESAAGSTTTSRTIVRPAAGATGIAIAAVAVAVVRGRSGPRSGSRPWRARPRAARRRRTGRSRVGPRAAATAAMPKPPIEEIFKRGQEVIVQVIKEGIGTKGPTLSTYISIAGRYLVLMPSLNRVGVSRKIEDHDARRRLREIMTDAEPAEGRRVHRPHRRHRPRREGTSQRPRVPAAALAGRREAHQASIRAGGDLPRIGHDHADDPRHLHERHRHDLGGRGDGVRARQGVPADRDAEVRQPHPLLREHRTAVPQVQRRGRDREDPPEADRDAARRVARHRADRGARRHRREQRELPGRQQRRGDRVPDEPARGEGDRPPAAAARPRRRDRQRLHRHAERDAPPQGRGRAPRRARAATAPGPRFSASRSSASSR